MRLRLVSPVVGLLALAAAGLAQTPPAPAPAPAPDPPALRNFTIGPIEVSGLVDAYYSLNFNHPLSKTNQLRNFDVRANQFSLGMAKLTLEHAADPVGFRLDIGAGRAFDIFHGTDPAFGAIRNVMQAYGSYKPGGGVQFDFGKFYTSAGAEVTETHLNWNYTRALLYANGPYYHFGLRTTAPMGKHFTGGFQIVNGWNNVEDNNSGKTVGLTGALTTSKVSWFNNYYVGPEKTDTNKGIRNFYDTVLLLTPNPKANMYINFDYGQEGNPGADASKFYGIAFAARLAPNDWFALSPRIEYYNDDAGFITGTKQKLKEFTLTAEFKTKDNLVTRLEYRRDWSDESYFERGGTLASAKSQSTLLAGIVVYFGPKK